MYDGAVTLAHHAVSSRDAWSSWSFEPVTVSLIGLTAVLYGVGAARIRRRGRPVAIRRAVAFYAGLVVLVGALLSPLHGLAELLLSAHMVQHLLLILVAPPLLVYGAAPLPVMVGLPPLIRRAAQRIRVLVRPPARALLNPVVVGCLNAAAMWSWHLPVLYRAGLESPALHALEHASFLGTALLFWAVVLAAGRPRRAPYGAAIVLVFATMLQSSALGAVLTFATRPLYSIHIAGAGEWGIDPLVDQELAGLIMWIPMGVIYLVTMAVLFGAWLNDSARRSPAVAPETPSR